MPLMTEEDVKNTAPDRKAFAAAKKIAKLDNWKTTGRKDNILWGNAVGSSDVYSVWVDTSAKELECSCPSRKRPCKHTLALCLMDATGVEIPEADVPSGHKWDAQERFYNSWE
jgi:hypothetical protein